MLPFRKENERGILETEFLRWRSLVFVNGEINGLEFGTDRRKVGGDALPGSMYMTPANGFFPLFLVAQ